MKACLTKIFIPLRIIFVSKLSASELDYLVITRRGVSWRLYLIVSLSSGSSFRFTI
jgi:hypothetical protein